MVCKTLPLYLTPPPPTHTHTCTTDKCLPHGGGSSSADSTLREDQEAGEAEFLHCVLSYEQWQTLWGGGEEEGERGEGEEGRGGRGKRRGRGGERRGEEGGGREKKGEERGKGKEGREKRERERGEGEERRGEERRGEEGEREKVNVFVCTVLKRCILFFLLNKKGSFLLSLRLCPICFSTPTSFPPPSLLSPSLPTRPQSIGPG